MSLISMPRPQRAALALCLLASVTLTPNVFAEESSGNTVSVLVEAGKEDGSLSQKHSTAMLRWQERVAQNRAAYLERMSKYRNDRKSSFVAVGSVKKRKPNQTRIFAGRGEGEGRVWNGINPFKSSKVEKPTPVKRQAPKGKYGALIAKYAKQHGVPYALARAVVQVESTFRPNVTGGAGEIGLMQIKLSTARGMGYKGTRKQLYNPATNLYWGMKYLGKAHKLAGGTTCGTILRYNAGHGAKRMNKVSARYCNKVKRILT